MQVAVFHHFRRPLLVELRAALAATDVERVAAAVAYVQTGGTLLLHDQLRHLVAGGHQVMLVAGVDMGITSVDGLHHLIDLGVEVYVYRARGHAFHGKTVVLADARGPREAFVGSGNWTRGGLASNSEFSTHLIATSQRDRRALVELDQEIAELAHNARSVRNMRELQTAALEFRIPSEERSRSRASDRRPAGSDSGPPSTSQLRSPIAPLLSSDAVNYQSRIFSRTTRSGTRTGASRGTSRRGAGAGGRAGTSLPASLPTGAPIGADVEKLLCTLNEVDTPNTPGELRLPVAALRAAPHFWGYPQRFTRTQGGRGGRVTFDERRVRCRFETRGMADTVVDGVRVYYYVERGEFRVTSHEFRERGAVDDLAVIGFDRRGMTCRIVRQTEADYARLIRLCVNEMSVGGARSRPRVWGFV